MYDDCCWYDWEYFIQLKREGGGRGGDEGIGFLSCVGDDDFCGGEEIQLMDCEMIVRAANWI